MSKRRYFWRALKIAKWRNEHKTIWYCLVISVFIGLFLLGTLLKICAPEWTGFWGHVALIVGDFVTKAVFVLLILDFFLLRLYRHHIVQEITEAVKPQLRAFNDRLRHAIHKCSDESTDRIVDELTTQSKSTKEILANVTVQGQSHLIQRIDDLEKHVVNVNSRMPQLERLCRNTMDMIQHVQSEIENVLKDTADGLKKEIASATDSKFKKAGYLDLHDRMEFDLLLNSLQKNQTLYFKDTFAPTWQEWINNLKEAVRRGAHVKMLIVKKGCRAAKDRNRQIRHRFKRFMPRLTDYTEAMHALESEIRIEQTHGSFEVRLYDETCNYPLYLIVDETGDEPIPIRAYCSFFLDQASIWLNHFEVGEPILSSFYYDVAAMWKRQGLTTRN